LPNRRKSGSSGSSLRQELRFAQPYNIFDEFQAAVSIEREDRLRMELHCLNRQIAMPDAHDNAVVGFGRHFKTRRQNRPLREKRMITAYLEPLRQALEYALTLMRHHRRFPVHRIIQHPEFPAKCLNDSLQAKAHAK